MKTFAMYVYCRRDGVSRDSGEQKRWNVEKQSDIPQSEINAEINWLRAFYDEVSYEIKEVADSDTFQ
jgi:hypothetical protein